MEANLKTQLPQEGTDSNEAGESLPELSSGCPSYSGGGTISLTSEDYYGVAGQAPEIVNTTGLHTKKKNFTQQTFHKGMFNVRPRSQSVSTPNNKFCTIDTGCDYSVIKPPEWQKVPETRKKKRPRMSDSPPHVIGLHNSFDKLPVDEGESSTGQPTTKKESKPPPLILYGIEDIGKLTEAIETVLGRSDYSFKIFAKNQLRVSCASAESYKKLMTLVREKGLIGHTFTRKEDKCYRIVIKNLHHTTPHEAIREEIEKTGNVVSGEIINARIGSEKIPSSTFFVNLVPNVNNKEVKKISAIFHTRVTIEEPRKRKTIVQCTKCQQYGHTKNNCLKPYRCVKCAEGHKTSDCPKTDRNSPAKCALCFGSHPANYKGCEVYKEIVSRRFRKRAGPDYKSDNRQQMPMRNEVYKQDKEIRTNRTWDRKLTDHGNTNPRIYFNSFKNKTTHQLAIDPAQIVKEPKSNDNTRIYSEVLRNKTTQQVIVEPTQVVQDLLIKQSEKIDILLQQISTLMGLMTKVLDRLLK